MALVVVGEFAVRTETVTRLLAPDGNDRCRAARGILLGINNAEILTLSGTQTGSGTPGGNNLPPTPIGFDRYMEENNLQRPGILYLYNGHTRQQLKIETKVPDSEVVLIDHDVVYYRIKQTIWSAAITPKGLSSPVLVADDPAILDVHWAFWGPTEVPNRK